MATTTHLTYRVEFVSEYEGETITGHLASVAMEGLGFHRVRTADVGGTLTAWGTLDPVAHDVHHVWRAMDDDDRIASYQEVDGDAEPTVDEAEEELTESSLWTLLDRDGGIAEVHVETRDLLPPGRGCEWVEEDADDETGAYSRRVYEVPGGYRIAYGGRPPQSGQIILHWSGVVRVLRGGHA